MEKQIKQLILLQNAEIEIANLKSKIKSLPEKLDALNEKLEEKKKYVEDKEDKLNSLNQEYRSLESDTRICISQIKKSEEKLLSVKTNKEYQSSLKEIDDLKQKNSQIESEMLFLIDNMDELEEVIAQEKNKYIEFSQKISFEKEELNKKIKYWKEELIDFEKQHMEISDSIDPVLLDDFNKIKDRQKNKIVMASVNNAICSECNMKIPPQKYNVLQSCEQLQFCPFCSRIIYWKGL